MTLYYSLVFIILVFEMVLFSSLVIPMPFTWKRKLFTFISENPLISKIQYWMKITFVFILILFLDSVNRVYRVQLELASVGKQGNGVAAVVGSERMEVQARKFYSQRNMYLCGFTLFLAIILNNTYGMILNVIRLEEENKRMKGDPRAGGKHGEQLENAGQAGEVGKLRRELEKKDKELQALKSQSEGLGKEYNRLGDQFTQADSTPKKDR